MAQRFFARATKLKDVGRFMIDLVSNQGVVENTITTTPIGLGSQPYVVFTYSNDIPVVATAGGATIEYEYGSSAPTWADLVAVTDGDHASGYSLAIDASAVDMDTVGTFGVIYVATDSSGNVSDAHTVTITIVDTTVPVITAANVNVNTEDSSVWVSAGTALDGYDGDISADLVLTYFKADGTTPLTALADARVDLLAGLNVKVKHNVDDANSNSAVEVIMTVTAVDNTLPVIVATTGDETIAQADAATWDNAFTATDNKDGDVSGNITDGSGIAYYESDGTTALGTQTLAAFRTHIANSGAGEIGVVTYDVDDAASNSAVQVTVTITCEATP